MFGLLNIALTDGYIGTFETKYHYRFWRPVTVIQLADIDGNPATIADPTWTPLEPTPPIPDYDSGHATEGGAAAQVLRQFFYSDRMRFSLRSFTLPAGQRCSGPSPTLRHFRSFSQAMNENGVSRIYIGFHFRDAVDTGIIHGKKIGKWTVNHVMRPIHRSGIESIAPRGHGDLIEATASTPIPVRGMQRCRRWTRRTASSTAGTDR